MCPRQDLPGQRLRPPCAIRELSRSTAGNDLQHPFTDHLFCIVIVQCGIRHVGVQCRAAAAGLHPPSAQGRRRPLHRPSAPGRQPASTLRAGTAARIDPSHWGRLAAPALRAGAADCTGRGCRRHRGGDRRHRRDDTPLPTQQRNARARAPSPASQHPAHHARRDNGRTPRPRWNAKFRHPLQPRQRRSVETTVCAVYFKLFVTARCFLGY